MSRIEERADRAFVVEVAGMTVDSHASGTRCQSCTDDGCEQLAWAQRSLADHRAWRAHSIPRSRNTEGVDPMKTPHGERPAEPGEVCTCGRPAVKVFTGGRFGDTGYCGLPDGGQKGPCAFCGGPRHQGQRCPGYQLRPTSDRPYPTTGGARSTT